MDDGESCAVSVCEQLEAWFHWSRWMAKVFYLVSEFLVGFH